MAVRNDEKIAENRIFAAAGSTHWLRRSGAVAPLSRDMPMNTDFYREFDQHLVELIAHKSVFTDDHDIKAALRYCMGAINEHADNRRTYFDAAGNLVSVSNNFDPNRNASLLSAHIDTVGANSAEWVSSTDPFTPVQTDTHIIGRGANDCKAGVALILSLGLLQRRMNISLDNVVFLISYREEGNREKTSVCIGNSLGTEIPLSNRENLLLCLENTVKVDRSYSIGIYDSEPCNIFIEITAAIAEIRDFLTSNPAWKPVYVSPLDGAGSSAALTTLIGKSGHAATVANADNVIHKAIFDGANHVISGGDYVQTSVIDNHVTIFDGPHDTPHTAVLNFRGLEAVADIKKKIAHLNFRERYPFAHADGSDRRLQLEKSFAKKLIGELNIEGMQPQFMSNPGRSDASAIWNATSHKDKLDILTMGPGSRSHVDQGIARKTHGPDEGFHRESGHIAVRYISNLVTRFLAGEQP